MNENTLVIPSNLDWRGDGVSVAKKPGENWYGPVDLAPGTSVTYNSEEEYWESTTANTSNIIHRATADAGVSATTGTIKLCSTWVAGRGGGIGTIEEISPGLGHCHLYATDSYDTFPIYQGWYHEGEFNCKPDIDYIVLPRLASGYYIPPIAVPISATGTSDLWAVWIDGIGYVVSQYDKLTSYTKQDIDYPIGYTQSQYPHQPGAWEGLVSSTDFGWWQLVRNIYGVKYIDERGGYDDIRNITCVLIITHHDDGTEGSGGSVAVQKQDKAVVTATVIMSSQPIEGDIAGCFLRWKYEVHDPVSGEWVKKTSNGEAILDNTGIVALPWSIPKYGKCTNSETYTGGTWSAWQLHFTPAWTGIHMFHRSGDILSIERGEYISNTCTYGYGDYTEVKTADDSAYQVAVHVYANGKSIHTEDINNIDDYWHPILDELEIEGLKDAGAVITVHSRTYIYYKGDYWEFSGGGYFTLACNLYHESITNL